LGAGFKPPVDNLDATLPAAVLAAVKENPFGRLQEPTALTAAARQPAIARVGTEEVPNRVASLARFRQKAGLASLRMGSGTDGRSSEEADVPPDYGAGK
jgi:hypothetical protein